MEHGPRQIRRRSVLQGILGSAAAVLLPSGVTVAESGKDNAEKIDTEAFRKIVRDFENILNEIEGSPSIILTEEQLATSQKYGAAYRKADEQGGPPLSMDLAAEGLRVEFVDWYTKTKGVDESELRAKKDELVQRLMVLLHWTGESYTEEQRNEFKKLMDSFWCGYDPYYFCPPALS